MDAQTRWAVEQIQKCLRDGNAAAVVEIGEYLVSHCADDLEVFMTAAFCLALGYEHLGQWERARARFEDCLAIDPHNPLLLAGRARVLLGMGKDDQAAALFQRLATEWPDHPDYLHAAGKALLQTGRLSEAYRFLAEARRLDPENPGLLNELGTAHLLSGQLDAALECFIQASDCLRAGDRRLARTLRENIEEVRAAIALHERARSPFAEARVVDLQSDRREEHEGESVEPPAEPKSKQVGPAETALGSRLVRKMRERGCRARQILAALHLLSDLLDLSSKAARARIDRKADAWLAAIHYTVGRLDSEPWARQKQMAAAFDVPVSAVSRRFVRLCRMLGVEVGDPRYSTVQGGRRVALIEEIRAGRTPPEGLLLSNRG